MDFIKKVTIISLLVVIILLLRSTFSVVMMVLAGAVIAIYFHGLGGLIERKLKLSHKWSMSISVCGSFFILVLLIWLVGTKIQSQISILKDKIPEMTNNAKSQLSRYSWGQNLLDEISGQNSKKLMSSVQRFFSSTFGVLGDLYIILFLGIFFTADPRIYRSGIIALIPPGKKKEGEHILSELGKNLKSWLKGKILSMAVVAVLTAIGLSIIGVPLIFTLSIIAGILNFIPNFGPMIAMIPAVLIGLSQDVNTALLVAGVYIFVQVLESNLITPLIQRKLVSIPPALIIVGQLIVGSVTGYLGIVLATPVVLIIMIMVKELYVKKQRT